MGKHGGRAAIRTRELTSRECEVLRALERGEPMKNIAVDLGIAIGSVKTFALRAYRKLDALDRAEAVKRHRRLKDDACGGAAR